jgi:hypothetical protein
LFLTPPALESWFSAFWTIHSLRLSWRFEGFLRVPLPPQLLIQELFTWSFLDELVGCLFLRSLFPSAISKTPVSFWSGCLFQKLFTFRSTLLLHLKIFSNTSKYHLNEHSYSTLTITAFICNLWPDLQDYKLS